MKARCYCPSRKAFKNYGGRGISVCDEWRNDFGSFMRWALANGYEPHLTIDRHPDNDGNYEPGNCRWSTRTEQNRNKRPGPGRKPVRYVPVPGGITAVTAFGVTKGVSAWTKDPRCQVGFSGLYKRLNQGEPPEIAISRPSRYSRGIRSRRSLAN